MNKKRIFSIIAILFAGLALTGCGDSNSSGNNNSGTKVGIVASDAYVVALNTPATLTLKNGKVYSSTNVKDGNITFDTNVSKKKLANAKIHIPDDAIVDTDGNGILDRNDQAIRTELYTMLLKNDNNETVTNNVVANPATTVDVLSDNIKGLKQDIHKYPVKLKEEALNYFVNNKNTQEQFEAINNLKLAAYNDVIADVFHILKKIADYKIQAGEKIDKNAFVKENFALAIKKEQISKLKDLINNDSISYDDFVTSSMNKLNNLVEDLNVKNNQEIENILNRTKNHLLGQKTVLEIAKNYVDNDEQKDNNKTEMKNIIHKFKHIMILLSDNPEIKPEQVLAILQKQPGISITNLLRQLNIQPNQEVLLTIKKHQEHDKFKNKDSDDLNNSKYRNDNKDSDDLNETNN